MYPWGWHHFLTPVLSDNPYLDCFLSAGIFRRRRVLAAMTQLLDDAATRDGLAERQAVLLKRLDELPPAGDALDSARLACGQTGKEGAS